MEKGAILVGHHSDAFQVSQQFTRRNEPRSLSRYGFREMAEWSIRSRRVPSYHYLSCKSKDPTGSKLEAIDNLIREGLMTREWLQGPEFRPRESESVFSSMDCRTVFFYVSGNAAARWLQLAILCETKDAPIVLADPNACVGCTIRNSDYFRETAQQSFFLL